MTRALVLAVLATPLFFSTAHAESQNIPQRANEGYVLMQDMNLDNFDFESDTERGDADSAVVHLPQNTRFFVDNGFTNAEDGQRYIQLELESGFKFWTTFESFDQALYIAEGQYAGGSEVGKVWWKPGWRTLSKGKTRCHQGFDIAYPSGSTIAARNGAGTVSQAGWVSGYGKCVTINHGNGMMSRYGHLSSIAVRTGQTVNTGQTIGKSGCTGRCSGPHLHYEHRKIGVSVCGGKKW